MVDRFLFIAFQLNFDVFVFCSFTTNIIISYRIRFSDHYISHERYYIIIWNYLVAVCLLLLSTTPTTQWENIAIVINLEKATSKLSKVLAKQDKFVDFIKQNAINRHGLSNQCVFRMNLVFFANSLWFCNNYLCKRNKWAGRPLIYDKRRLEIVRKTTQSRWVNRYLYKTKAIECEKEL